MNVNEFVETEISKQLLFELEQESKTHSLIAISLEFDVDWINNAEFCAVFVNFILLSLILHALWIRIPVNPITLSNSIEIAWTSIDFKLELREITFPLVSLASSSRNVQFVRLKGVSLVVPIIILDDVVPMLFLNSQSSIEIIGWRLLGRLASSLLLNSVSI